MFLPDVHHTVMALYVHELSVIIPHSVRFIKSLTHEMVNSIVRGVAMWNMWNFILEHFVKNTLTVNMNLNLSEFVVGTIESVHFGTK